MWWVITAIADGVVAVAYLAIATAILRPLISEHQVRANKLGTATALIFLTTGVYHATHTVHMVLPSLGVHSESGLAMRQAFDVDSALWDVLTALVGVYYWTLRRAYAPLMHGAKLFEDLRERQRRALEINDNIVQGLAVAQLALVTGEHERSLEAMEATLASARTIISDLLGEVGTETRLGPGDLRRSLPAALHH